MTRAALSAPRVRLALLGALCLLVGVGIGYLLGSLSTRMNVDTVRYSGEFEFISPPLYTVVPEEYALQEYGELKEVLTEQVQAAIAHDDVSQVALYFRDLNANQWIGVNQDDSFEGASLFKVATLITVLRLAEANQSLTTKLIHLENDLDYVPQAQDYYPPQHPLRPGGTYPFSKVVYQMIVESDNVAFEGLNALAGIPQLRQTLTDLHISVPVEGEDHQTTPREYSHLFRALYNGTYLSKNTSESALELLSRTAYHDGLVAGVPEGTMVAHKFGQRSIESEAATVRELHDCGIIYFSEHPYFLCIMTKGNNYDALANVIKTLSQTTWEGVAQRYAP